MKRISKTVLLRLYRQIKRNNTKWINREPDVGIPVAAVLFRAKKQILYSRNNLRENSHGDKSGHAEAQCIKGFRSIRHKDLRLLITTPPCESCAEVIRNDNRIINICWLFPKLGKDSVEEFEGIETSMIDSNNLDSESKKIYDEMHKIYMQHENNKFKKGPKG